MRVAARGRPGARPGARPTPPRRGGRAAAARAGRGRGGIWAGSGGARATPQDGAPPRPLLRRARRCGRRAAPHMGAPGARACAPVRPHLQQPGVARLELGAVAAVDVCARRAVRVEQRQQLLALGRAVADATAVARREVGGEHDQAVHPLARVGAVRRGARRRRGRCAARRQRAARRLGRAGVVGGHGACGRPNGRGARAGGAPVWAGPPRVGRADRGGGAQGARGDRTPRRGGCVAGAAPDVARRIHGPAPARVRAWRDARGAQGATTGARGPGRPRRAPARPDPGPTFASRSLQALRATYGRGDAGSGPCCFLPCW
jgi:hypothetical protein